jgi:hypothetical protein
MSWERRSHAYRRDEESVHGWRDVRALRVTLVLGEKSSKVVFDDAVMDEVVK